MGELRYTYSNGCSGRPYSREILRKFRTKDNAFVVMDGSRVVFASEMERFTKEKHDFRNPIWAKQAFFSTFPSDEVPRLSYIGNQVDWYEHHDAHIYEAFYQSGFHESAVLVNDGKGTADDCVTLAYIREGKKPLILKKFNQRNSPCALYALVSGHIFYAEHTEGKLMGLAAYGSDDGNEYIKWDFDRNEISTNEELVVQHIKAIHRKDEGVMAKRDVAFTVQKNFEEVMVEVVKFFYKMLEERGIHTENLCMSGGGVLNCPTNSKIVDLGFFKNYYASPQPSDGCAESVGKALINLEAMGESLQSRRLKNAYLGACYSCESYELPIEYKEEPYFGLCEHLQNGGVVAWYQDGAEYGPRALGHRSFLADPSSKEMLDALNKIKGREMWRPLAPIVPEELFPRIFDVENTDMCEFMLRTLPIKERWRPRLQAVCHVDGTTRPQLLKKQVNPELYDLLMSYFERTHVPCLVNTSLNINGFPIVETLQDFLDISEEMEYMKDIPKRKCIYVEKGEFFELFSDRLHLNFLP